MLFKTCSKCRETKPVSGFSKNAGKRDGLQTYCKKCHVDVNAKWDSANREKVTASSAKWAAENSDKVRAASAKWAAANPKAKLAHNHNYRARKVDAGGKLSKGIGDKLYKLQKGKCACCGELLGDDYHLDHILPLALGGTNTDDNIQLLRSTCNSQKHAKHPVDFMQQRGFLL